MKKIKKSRKMNIKNTSGYTGVNWSKEKGMWHSKICINNKRIHLGYFSDIEIAANAYKAANYKYNKNGD